MKLIDTIKNIWSGRKAAPVYDDYADYHRGWVSTGGLTATSNDEYENVYDNVIKITNTAALVAPYLVNGQGKTVEQPEEILKALYSPNKKMSALRFRRALSILTLTRDEVYVRVHYRGSKRKGQIPVNQIMGFSFIDRTIPVRLSDGRLQFNLPSGEVITDDEVLVLSDVNPADVNTGFAPTRAARRWVQLDDYVNDYQRGFFKNGAVPAGQFVITANSLADFRDIKKQLELTHRGAAKNNNVIYTYRPAKNVDGKEMDAQIIWVPFASANKDLSLKDLMDMVERRKNGNFGVPAEIKGFLQNSNYASVVVAERVFDTRVVLPHLTGLWDTFSHELARVTGGFGAAISFDFELAEVAEEELQQANRRKVDAETLGLFLDQGFTLASIQEFMTSHDCSVLKLQQSKPPKPPKPPVDDPNVTSDQEIDDDPDQANNDVKSADDHHHHDCPHHNPRNKSLSDEVREAYEMELTMIIKNRMNEQIERAVAALGKSTKSKTKATDGDYVTTEDDEKLADELLAVLLVLIAIQGRVEQAQGLAMMIEAGLPTNAVEQFEVLDRDVTSYKKYLTKVASSYNADTAQAIRQTLAAGFETGITTAELKERLRAIGLDDYRINRLAKSEVNRGANRAGQMAMSQIKADTGYIVEKTWRTRSGNPCEYCRAMDGTILEVDESFAGVGEEITGVDGGTYKNTFVNMVTCDMHPFCECEAEWTIREA